MGAPGPPSSAAARMGRTALPTPYTDWLENVLPGVSWLRTLPLSVTNSSFSEGYEVISIVPLTSGRAVEATVEAEEKVHGRTYIQSVPVDTKATDTTSDITSLYSSTEKVEEKHYVDTGVGYSVTDGVIITAMLRG